MSNTMRWVIGILLIFFGIAAAGFSIFGGAFSTIACLKSPPDWVYSILLIGGLIMLAGTVAPAVMLIRKMQGKYILGTLALGVILSCGIYAMYLYLLGQNC